MFVVAVVVLVVVVVVPSAYIMFLLLWIHLFARQGNQREVPLGDFSLCVARAKTWIHDARVLQQNARLLLLGVFGAPCLKVIRDLRAIISIKSCNDVQDGAYRFAYLHGSK